MTRFALIGCGKIGARHAAQIQRTGTLVATCDTDIDKAKELAPDANAYAQIDELLEAEHNIDVVVVCTPNGLHAEHVIKSLQSRKHVLCEKPLCIASSAAWSMRDTAHFFRRHLFVVKQVRFNHAVLKVKEVLDSGSLGNVLSFSLNGFWNRSQEYYDGGWHGTNDLDGGILYTQFSHFIDIMLWFLGDVAEIKSVVKNSHLRKNLQIEDTVVGLLRMVNGAIGAIHFSINAFPENKEGSFSLLCEKGSIKLGGHCLNQLEWDLDFPDESDLKENINTIGDHSLLYDELLKALDNKPNNLPHINDAVRTIQAIESIYAIANRS